jgi:hypothetical protein
VTELADYKYRDKYVNATCISLWASYWETRELSLIHELKLKIKLNMWSGNIPRFNCLCNIPYLYFYWFGPHIYISSQATNADLSMKNFVLRLQMVWKEDRQIVIHKLHSHKVKLCLYVVFAWTKNMGRDATEVWAQIRRNSPTHKVETITGKLLLFQ